MSGDMGGDVKCPGCAEIIDAFELYTHNAGGRDDGTSRCLSCGERFADHEFVSANAEGSEEEAEEEAEDEDEEEEPE